MSQVPREEVKELLLPLHYRNIKQYNLTDAKKCYSINMLFQLKEFQGSHSLTPLILVLNKRTKQLGNLPNNIKKCIQPGCI